LPTGSSINLSEIMAFKGSAPLLPAFESPEKGQY